MNIWRISAQANARDSLFPTVKHEERFAMKWEMGPKFSSNRNPERKDYWVEI